jgi:hypothetical protein
MPSVSKRAVSRNLKDPQGYAYLSVITYLGVKHDKASSK